MSAQAMQRWATAARLPPRHGTAQHSSARNLSVPPRSLIYGVITLEGAPALLGLFIV